MLTREDYEQIAAAFRGGGTVGWQRADCPLCEGITGKADDRASMGLNADTGGFVCHKCQVHGRLPPDLHERQEDDGFELEDEPAQERAVEPADGYTPLYERPGFDTLLLDPARAYLEGRGLSPWALREAEVGAAVSGRLAGRVIVPVLGADPLGPWHGWVGRDYTNTMELRYRYSKGMTRDRLWNQRRLHGDDPVMVVEGVFDGLPYWPAAVALLGKPTKHHLDVFTTPTVRASVVVCLDGDAWEEGWTFSLTLAHLGVRAGHVRLPPGEDPCSVDHGWLRAEVEKVARGL